MPNTHIQITGLGPVQEDGSVEIFTVLPTPFKVTKEWLEQYPAMPAVGDDLVKQEDGKLLLNPAANSPAAPPVEDAQKKTDGSGGSAGSQEDKGLKT